MKKVVTQDDLDQNPELVEQGVQVGDEIEIPETESSPESEGEIDGKGPGSTNPPGNPPTKP